MTNINRRDTVKLLGSLCTLPILPVLPSLYLSQRKEEIEYVEINTIFFGPVQSETFNFLPLEYEFIIEQAKTSIIIRNKNLKYVYESYEKSWKIIDPIIKNQNLSYSIIDLHTYNKIYNNIKTNINLYKIQQNMEFIFNKDVCLIVKNAKLKDIIFNI